MVNLFPKMKNNSLLFAGVLLVCFSLSVFMRYHQFETWKKTPAAFFVGERPMMTTLDAPYWLRLAREYNEGNYGLMMESPEFDKALFGATTKDRLRSYPDGTESFHEKLVEESGIPPKFKDHTSYIKNSPPTSETIDISYRDLPLLSFLIAHIAPFFNYNYYLAGTLIIPFLASLFMLPLGIYFFKIGVPVLGLFGGLIGTFAGAYYMRSSMGRIDTDMLNLFFPVMSSLLILMASRAKSERAILLYSI